MAAGVAGFYLRLDRYRPSSAPRLPTVPGRPPFPNSSGSSTAGYQHGRMWSRFSTPRQARSGGSVTKFIRDLRSAMLTKGNPPTVRSVSAVIRFFVAMRRSSPRPFATRLAEARHQSPKTSHPSKISSPTLTSNAGLPRSGHGNGRYNAGVLRVAMPMCVWGHR